MNYFLKTLPYNILHANKHYAVYVPWQRISQIADDNTQPDPCFEICYSGTGRNVVSFSKKVIIPGFFNVMSSFHKNIAILAKLPC